MTRRQSSARQVGEETVDPAPQVDARVRTARMRALSLVGRSALNHLDSEARFWLPLPVDWEFICFIISSQRASIAA